MDLKRLCFAGSMALTIAVSGSAASWPQYRGPHGDGITTEVIPTQWNGGKPKELWKISTPNGFSSFAVAEGKAFTVVSRPGAGSLSEVCVAIDASTGRELWAVGTGIAKYPGGGDSGAEDNKGGDGPRSTPTVSDGRVYVYSADMVLTCLDAGWGKALWTKDIIKEFAGKNIDWKSALSPVVDGNLVFIAGGGPGQSMIALNKATGEVAWKTGTEAMTHAAPVVVTMHGIRQIIYMMQSGLVALDTATGKVLWNFPFPYRVSTACLPVVGDDLVFCTAGYDIGSAVCRVTKTGDRFKAEEVWRTKGNNPIASLWSPPVYKDGYLYGTISFKKYTTGPLKCVDLKTGKVAWEKDGFGAGNVILAGKNLLALTDKGEIVVIDPSPEAYKEIARFKAIDGKCWSTPALAEGRLFVRSTKQGACYDLKSQ